MSTREEIIAAYFRLLSFMAEHPDVPIRDRLDGYCVLADDDETGMAELHRIAAALGVEVVESVNAHPCAVRKFGAVEYEAFYVRRAAAAEYGEMTRLGREALIAQRADGEAPDA